MKYQQLEGQWAEKLRRAQEELEKLRRRLEEAIATYIHLNCL